MRVTDVTDKAVKLELEAPGESISPIRLTAAPMCPEYLCGMTLSSWANIVFKLLICFVARMWLIVTPCLLILLMFNTVLL